MWWRMRRRWRVVWSVVGIIERRGGGNHRVTESQRHRGRTETTRHEEHEETESFWDHEDGF